MNGIADFIDSEIQGSFFACGEEMAMRCFAGLLADTRGKTPGFHREYRL